MLHEAPFWTWKQFNAAVDELCPLESERMFGKMNDDGSSVYYRKKIRQAVLDLQNFIPEFIKNHETIYYNADLTTDGECSVGTMPPSSQICEAWYYSVDRQRRYKVHQVPWGERYEKMAQPHRHHIANPIGASEASLMAISILGKVEGHQFHGRMSISPDHQKFYVSPKIENEWLLSIFWDGQKLDFKPDEFVPMGEEAAQAVALYVQSDFARYVERDLPRATDLNAQYNIKRSNIFTRTKAKGTP